MDILESVPYEIAVYALSNHNNLVDYVKTKLCYLNNIFSVYNDFSSTNIGRRYVRSDAIGISLTITVDFQTLNDDTITVRHSSDGHQDRIHANNIVEYIQNLLTK